MTLNLSKLLYQNDEISFHTNTEPLATEEAALREAKEIIRDYLKKAIPLWIEEKFGERPEHKPRFRTQGSWAYRTCNEPCQHPPQEMDWDLGIYLPVSLWDDQEVHPRRAAKEYFNMVRELMLILANEQGWTVTEKPTCVRVVLNNGIRAHVDLPLYAAPDKDFAQIREIVAAKALALDEARQRSAQRIDDWDSLNRICLACQDGSWSVSDPGLVVKWFKGKIDRHGPQIRRICRYLKAWRDYVWVEGGPSSIVLMVCAAKTLDRTADDLSGRDDFALRTVLESLPDQLRKAVIEPMINPGEDLNRLDQSQRAEAASCASQFFQALDQALTLNEHERTKAIKLIQGHLGERFPDNPELIALDKSPVNIRTVPAEPRPRQVIKPTKAGKL
ncbi:MAG: CBASS cGAMP synthase [Candidatus Binatia bacterium]